MVVCTAPQYNLLQATKREIIDSFIIFIILICEDVFILDFINDHCVISVVKQKVLTKALTLFFWTLYILLYPLRPLPKHRETLINSAGDQQNTARD